MSDLISHYETMAADEGRAGDFEPFVVGFAHAFTRMASRFDPTFEVDYVALDLPEDLREPTRTAVQRGLPKCESPIEQRLLPWLVSQEYAGFKRRPCVLFPGEQAQLEPYTVAVVPQMPIGPYRVDFALVARQAGEIGIVVVECDGAAFHEDVHRDIARDRWLLNHRRILDVQFFSGREIYRDIKAVAREASAAFTQAWRRPTKKDWSSRIMPER